MTCHLALRQPHLSSWLGPQLRSPLQPSSFLGLQLCCRVLQLWAGACSDTPSLLRRRPSSKGIKSQL